MVEFLAKNKSLIPEILFFMGQSSFLIGLHYSIINLMKTDTRTSMYKDNIVNYSNFMKILDLTYRSLPYDYNNPRLNKNCYMEGIICFRKQYKYTECMFISKLFYRTNKPEHKKVWYKHRSDQ